MKLWRFRAFKNSKKLLVLTFLVICSSLCGLYVTFQFKENTLFSEETNQLKGIRRAEFRYKETLKKLSDSELDIMRKRYYRDVALHWGSVHGLLPQGKPLPHVSCLRHLDTQFTVSVSVVMCMRNELIYLLLRTLTTIVRRTPKRLLHEIVLIDDGSDFDALPEIRNYSSQLNIPLKILRNNKSVGITSCRRYGIEKAEGEVVVLLDSHMEVSELWLEPLLDILHSKPDGIAVPTLHLINEKEYDSLHLKECNAYGIEAVAGYSYFRYYVAGPPADDQSAPYSTASVLGGGLAAYKSTFIRLYPKIVFKELWGTENTRLAIRAWACGGGLWMTRCSQVLHTNGHDGDLDRYKGKSPDMTKHLQYETVGDISNFITTEKDKMRFFQSIFKEETEIKEVKDIAKIISTQFDVSKCSKDFHWFLKNIFPSSHYLQFVSTDYSIVGEAQSMFDKTYCVKAGNKKVSVDKNCRNDKTAFYDDHLVGISKKGDIHMTYFTLFCFDQEGKSAEGTEVMLHGCHTKNYGYPKAGATQNFVYEGKRIVHVPSNNCLQLDVVKGSVELWKCNDSMEQKWNIVPARWTQL